ncbi:hypothetical protein [Candidatus Solincola tengchongensis]|uniref:hypothetical protein n=1 Tax=Candidatus Solincola tengchongensis TaxID=2900693 RepID=UPI00257C6657|nr:hypothetical protein [Candidatus Solincola tengchongensis]
MKSSSGKTLARRKKSHTFSDVGWEETFLNGRKTIGCTLLALLFALTASLAYTERLAPTMALWSDTEELVAVISIQGVEMPGVLNEDAPVLLFVEPLTLYAGTFAEVVVTCSNNPGQGFAISMWNEVASLQPSQMRALSDGRFLCTFDLRDVGAGVFTLTLRTPEGKEASLPSCLTVLVPDSGGGGAASPGREGKGGGGGAVSPTPGDPARTAPSGGNGTPASPDRPPWEGPVDDASPPNGGQDQKPRGDEPTPGGIGGFKVTPSVVNAALSVELLIEGGVFRTGWQARLTRSGYTAWSVSFAVLSETQVRCGFNLLDLAPGVYKLEITDYRDHVIYCIGYVKVI